MSRPMTSKEVNFTEDHEKLLYWCALRVNTVYSYMDIDDLVNHAWLRYARRFKDLKGLTTFILSCMCTYAKENYKPHYQLTYEDGKDRGDYNVNGKFLDDSDASILLKNLTRKQRESIKLYYLKGVSQKDIAKKLGISRQAVHLRIKNGIDILRRQYAHQRNEFC